VPGIFIIPECPGVFLILECRRYFCHSERLELYMIREYPGFLLLRRAWPFSHSEKPERSLAKGVPGFWIFRKWSVNWSFRDAGAVYDERVPGFFLLLRSA